MRRAARPAQVKVERYDVYLTPEAEAALPAGAAGEVDLWRAGVRPHPLTQYGVRNVAPLKLGKGLIDPEFVASYEARARAQSHVPPGDADSCRAKIRQTLDFAASGLPKCTDVLRAPCHRVRSVLGRAHNARGPCNEGIAQVVTLRSACGPRGWRCRRSRCCTVLHNADSTGREQARPAPPRRRDPLEPAHRCTTASSST